MDECPNIKQLESLASGSLVGLELAGCMAHVETCGPCREQLEECRENLAYFAKARTGLMQIESSRRSEARDLDVTAANEMETSDEPPDSLPSSMAIPGCQILRELHRGGQGVVYEAIQTSTKRKVAVKIMLEGPYASRSAKRRFEREIELVASLRHPNIISIFDSGQTLDGQHYYVMDYIRGVPLHRYVRDGKLNIREALKLFACVCDAVNYAHQKGVIHRDLKPSNILVDSKGEPKVLDFGLAKMVGGPEATMVSLTGQVVGTLPYISPEQARGNPEEIDLRTDVYAMGVILYQILTGQYPYPVTGQPAEVLKHITDTPPTPPSKAWQIESGISSVSERRVRINCPIDDEVQTIVLKSLTKERDRRYQSVGELACDVRRYLEGQPIEAKRDSGWYVLRKLVDRNRMAVTIAGTFVVVIGAGLLMIGQQRAQSARQQMALNLKRAHELVGLFAQNAGDALVDVHRADKTVGRNVASIATAHAFSVSPPERVMGAVASFAIAPQAFWQAVDDGPLWKNGEWLEVARADWPDIDRVLNSLVEKAVAGTAYQKYVAFSLMGHFGTPRPDLIDACVNTVNSAGHPGVIGAARWAAMRLGKNVPYPYTNNILIDDLAGMTFVRVPESDSYRLGTAPSDRDRREDESIAGQVMRVPSFYMSTSEVTLTSLAPFVADSRNADIFGPFDDAFASANPDIIVAAARIREQIEAQSDEEAAMTPANWISLTVARRYCEWLTQKAKIARLARTYRLPTEDEWEYACRGGNGARFCYGDSSEYANFFANAQGAQKRHRVGEYIPNMYGLFDMHGGLWEWCDSAYPPDLVTDSRVTPEQGKNLFVLRGGAFYSPAVRCRCTQRNYGDARTPNEYAGFRVVAELTK